MNFSILMSIYHKENHKYFHRCMESIWDNQTVKADEIILVKDGPLTDDLNQAIKKWKTKIGNRLKVIVLKENMGLGYALNIGLSECSYDIVARMDTDDIAYSNRFQVQIDFLKSHPKIDVVSSYLSEFETIENKIVSYKKIPLLHHDIVLYSKIRNPINHPSVTYRKNAVMDAGNYKTMPGFEDYYLWVRMLQNGVIMANIDEPLVYMRAGYSQLQRRRGLKYAISEYLFQRKLLQIGFINTIEFIRNITIRFISRILPKFFVKIIYNMLRNE